MASVKRRNGGLAEGKSGQGGWGQRKGLFTLTDENFFGKF